MGTENSFQPNNMPPKVKMLVRGVPAVIDYEEQQIITPNGLGRNYAMVIGQYLVDEGFLEYPEDEQDPKK